MYVWVGACGYQNGVEQAPFSSIVAASASSIYNSGMRCGTCYQVKCTTVAACSGNPVTVVLTDDCHGCDSQSILFDLSCTSFGAMATSGEANQLRDIVGIAEIQYRRVDCNFPGVSVAFRVDPGSNANYFATAIKYENDDGIGGVELKQAVDSSGAWFPTMQRLWGAVWKVDIPSNLQPPFSIRQTSGDNSGNSIVANEAIPANYKLGEIYSSIVNF